MSELSDLQTTAQRAYKLYQTNRQKAVRGGGFIENFHSYCIRELQRAGLPSASIKVRGRPVIEFSLSRNVRILGGYVDKEVDVMLTSDTSGPLLAISVKSQMSSIAANIKNRFEEYLADATNLHSRFPMLVFGFLMIVPYATYDENGSIVEEIIGSDGQPTPLAQRIKRRLQSVTGRMEPISLPGTYEEASLLVMDFAANPVIFHPTFPEIESNLRIEGFFDRLVKRYHQRNPYL